ncbi:UNVERIFIED_CONTAM: hypothetical protein Slati_0884500 [Sesamum latifolium]|uniref:Uncharacterized protein n=1 Tax=Sesamum latifolium TaxID=2727402 RepID=A0AAW2XPE7_9LAMI
MALNTYWAMAFVLPKGVIREIERRLRSFLWKGTTGFGHSKVAWARVCTPVEEGGLGIRNLLALNMAMIARKLWEVVQHDSKSIWVQWVYQVRLRERTVWTALLTSGSWSWRKMLRLRAVLLPHMIFHIGDGTGFFLWHDPWHHLGPLISRFPLGPNITGTHSTDLLQSMIVDGC